MAARRGQGLSVEQRRRLAALRERRGSLNDDERRELASLLRQCLGFSDAPVQR